MNEPAEEDRPWGRYCILDEGAGYKVKRIVVKSGARLSLQAHRHRSEHWVVVAGVAEVQNGNQSQRLARNQRTYIPAEQIHRLGNAGENDLVLIEIQCGSYLGEDDIVRLADDYQRSSPAPPAADGANQRA